MEKQETFTDGFTLAIDTVQGWSEAFYARLPNLIVGIFILLLIGFLAYGTGKLVQSYFNRKGRTDLGRILADFGFWGMMVFGVLLALTIIIPSIKPADMLASLGIGSLAFGFAFKDILQNWLAGLLILLRMPFRRGDQIIIDEAEGTVMRIEPRATIIRTYDGCDIVVPNTRVYTSMVQINTSQEIRRVQLNFTVGYAYDIRQMTEIIENSLAQVDEILQDPPPQILCWTLGSTSLEMRLRWWINSERSEEVISRSRAVQAIKEAFDANDIDPTDPQLIYYQNAPHAEPYSDGSPPEVHKQKTQSKKVAAGPPPPKMIISKNDPEAESIKMDSKDGTLLADK
jgi:small-conductance mechanosensitive channel